MKNGVVLSRDQVVAVVEGGHRSVVLPRLCPLYLLAHDDVEGWLCRRAIDAHRTNSRLLRKALHLAPNDDLAAVLRVHGATITDGYWVRQAGEALTYEEVRFQENTFGLLALRGDPDSFQRGSPQGKTPELTNIGSFEKCWKRENQQWWMVKLGNAYERFSELFICAFGQALGLSMAQYRQEGDTVCSLDFIQGKWDFEPMYSLVLEDEDYKTSYRALRALCPEAARAYTGMVYLDALVLNMDRHTQNYGLLREGETGAIRSLAPLFDHNIALVARGYPSQVRREGDLLSRLFLELMEEPEALADFRSLGLAVVDNDLVERVLEEVARQTLLSPLPKEVVCPALLAELILSAHQWIWERIPGE